MSISYNPERIIANFHDMSEEEQRKYKIGCGAIDEAELFEKLYNYTPTPREFEAFQNAAKEAYKLLNRCQHDMLIAEFGQETVSVAEAVMATDALFKEPLESNVHKLNYALRTIYETTDQPVTTARRAERYYEHVNELMRAESQKA